MPVYNKLVRDKILEMIESDGLAYNARILESGELLKEIKEKMIEEAKEFQSTETDNESLEELADVLELIHTALVTLGRTFEELNEVRLKKKKKRGGFEKAVYLIDVEDR
ncbi:MAG: nucleoside triphosphate pyrophosphohydrolase [Solibacillus sp.]|uniref:nucleoside triphosphate pyrophosphohydrolase n=1 Tax=Solibacillus sp. TaxID=1909654 RepID=UPI003314B655